MIAGLERHGTRWTSEEILQLITLYEQGERWGIIAHTLKRTVPTCVMRLRAVRFYYRMPHKIWKLKNETMTRKNLSIKKRMDNGAKN